EKKEEGNSQKERVSEKKGEPDEKLEIVQFKKKVKEKTFRIGTNMNVQHRSDLIALIREYEDVFAWGPEDMPGIDPQIAIH
ncbi:hypothetical protein, partial [Mycobacterium tuberculosis]